MLLLETSGRMIHGGSCYKSIGDLGFHLQQLRAILHSDTGTLRIVRFSSANETASDAIRRFLAEKGVTVDVSAPYMHEGLGLVEHSWQSAFQHP